MLPESKIRGFWIRKNKTFYYLECGDFPITTSLDRLKSTLISKGFLKISTEGKEVLGEEPYLEMSLETAKMRGYEIKRLFLNSHIKTIIENSEKEKAKKGDSLW